MRDGSAIMDMVTLELANFELVMPITHDDTGSYVSEESELIDDFEINCDNHARAAACLNIVETRQSTDYVPLETVP